MRLVIDSVAAACSVALIGDDGALIDERHEIVERGHAERLLPLVEALLGGRVPTAILVDCGPGSFTGVRVGLAAAHGLAIGWRVPLSGYSSTALIAATAGRAAVTVAMAGGHGELFVQSFGGDPLAPLDDLRSLPIDAAAEALADDDLYGSGAEALVAHRGFGRAHHALPRAADARLLPSALCTLPPRPIYGRAPDAKPMK